MEPYTESDRPINLDGKLKLGAGTLVAIAVAMFTLAGIFSKLPSKSDMQESFAAHNTSADSHPALYLTLQQLRAESERLELRMSRLEERQNETHDDVTHIRNRIDYLTEQTVRQEARAEALQRTTPVRAQQAADRAIKSLHQGATPKSAVQQSLDGI